MRFVLWQQHEQNTGRTFASALRFTRGGQNEGGAQHFIGLMLPLWAQDYSRVVGPIAHVYATTDGVELKLVIHERVVNGLTFRFRRLGRRSGRQGVHL